MNFALQTELQAWLCACRIRHLPLGKQVFHPQYPALGECNFFWLEDARLAGAALLPHAATPLATHPSSGDAHLKSTALESGLTAAADTSPLPHQRIVITQKAIQQKYDDHFRHAQFTSHRICILALGLHALGSRRALAGGNHHPHWCETPLEAAEIIALHQYGLAPKDPLHPAIAGRFKELQSGIGMESLYFRGGAGEVNAALGTYAFGHFASIQWVKTHPDHRRQGLARNLVQFAIQFWQQRGQSALSLAVTADNHGALRLYKNIGFKNVANIWIYDPPQIFI